MLFSGQQVHHMRLQIPPLTEWMRTSLCWFQCPSLIQMPCYLKITHHRSRKPTFHCVLAELLHNIYSIIHDMQILQFQELNNYPVDNFGTVVGENPTPYGILALWAVNSLSIVYWVCVLCVPSSCMNWRWSVHRVQRALTVWFGLCYIWKAIQEVRLFCSFPMVNASPPGISSGKLAELTWNPPRVICMFFFFMFWISVINFNPDYVYLRTFDQDIETLKGGVLAPCSLLFFVPSPCSLLIFSRAPFIFSPLLPCNFSFSLLPWKKCICSLSVCSLLPNNKSQSPCSLLIFPQSPCSLLIFPPSPCSLITPLGVSKML